MGLLVGMLRREWELDFNGKKGGEIIIAYSTKSHVSVGEHY